MSKRKCNRGKEPRSDLGDIRNEPLTAREDYLSPLPEEILLVIFGMVAELKSLALCCLVSKRFASLVPRVKTVYVTLPMGHRLTVGVPMGRRLTVGDSLFDVKGWKTQKPKQLVFLGKFRELEYVHLEYKYGGVVANSPFAMWMIKFGSDFPKIERFAALINASIHKQTGNESNGEQNDATFEQSHVDDCTALIFGCGSFVKWISIVVMLGQSHASLKRVTVTDSAKKGKMVIEDEQLVGIRSREFKPVEELFTRGLGVAKIPELHLPSSGFVMKQVSLILNHPTDPLLRDMDEMVSRDLDEGEKVLGEAIKEIYKNHRHQIDKLLI